LAVASLTDHHCSRRAHSGIAIACLSAAEKLYESVVSSRAEREHKANQRTNEGNADDEACDEEEKENGEAGDEQNEVAQMLELLLEGRERLMACVKIEPDQRDYLLSLCSVLTLLGEMTDDSDESEMYFSEVRSFVCVCVCVCVCVSVCLCVCVCVCVCVSRTQSTPRSCRV
jgi:uncharacterized membrane protein YdbT with pleckstrin-like domain